MFKLLVPGDARVTPLLMLIACSVFCGPPAGAQTEAAHKPALTLEDLFSEPNVVDTDISPNGKLIAAVVRHNDDDALVCVDLTTGEKTRTS